MKISSNNDQSDNSLDKARGADLRPDPHIPLLPMIDSGLIHQKFLECARAHPQAVAISDSRLSLSYQELEFQSRQLASRILVSVKSPDSIIAVHGRRSTELVVTMLACLRAKLTFAVLDAAYPPEKLHQLHSIIQPALVVGPNSNAEELQHLFGETDSLLIAAEDLQNNLDECLTEEALTQITSESPQCIAYLLFTSGTTGTPKCIKTSHTPLIHFIDFYSRTFKPSVGSRFSLLSGLAHDPVLRDIFVALSVGGEICVPDPELMNHPEKLSAWFSDAKINYLHASPQLLKLIAAAEKALPDLRYVFSGGDVLHRRLVEEIHRLAQHSHVVNFYGATETPQAMAYHVVRAEDTEPDIPVGRGIADVQLLVLRKDLSHAEIGERGQIAIRTHFLSEGYLNDDFATNAKFIHSPFSDAEKDPIYLTGDYGVYRSDGAVLVKGREDDQVKIRGYRVELGEVKRAIESEVWVEAVVVLTQKTNSDELALVSFVVARQLPADPTLALKAAVEAKLPAYMVPARVVWLEKMPLLPNGKIDRNQLLQMDAVEEHRIDFEIDESEQSLVREFQKILSLPKIDTQHSFVQLGGDSLSYIQASRVVEDHLGHLPVDWEKMPLNTLSTLEATQARLFRKIGTTIFIRALSIFLVVFSHFSSVYGGIGINGSTSALFVVAGWSFGRYQMMTVAETGRVTTLLKTLFAIVLPTFLYTLFLELRYSSVNWKVLLMIGNFFRVESQDNFSYWFINVLIQMQVILLLLFSFGRVRDEARKNPYRFALFATLICAVAGAAIHQAWNTDYLFDRVPHMKLWLFFLGAAIAFAKSWREKAILSAIALVGFYIDQLQIYSLVCVLFILLVNRLSVLRGLTNVLNITAASSLFIYLTHFQFDSIYKKIPLPRLALVESLFAVAGGIIIWMVWNQLFPRAMLWLSRLKEPHIK